MPDAKPAPASPKPKRKWWRRLLRGFAWTALILVVLHRPLILWGGPRIARMIAKGQHLDVSFSLSGSILWNLEVSNVKVSPNGTGPTPVQSITIDRARLDYSLWRLVHDGVGWFISSYELHHVDLNFVALPSKTKEEREKKKSIAETLRLILTQPAAYSDRVLIEDFNLHVRSPKDVTAIEGLNLLLHPEDPGYMRIDRIQIPGLPTWDHLQSETSYVSRNLFQKNLRLTPDILIDELNFDASQRAQGIGTVSLKAHAFGGEADVELIGQELPGEGKHLPKRYETHLKTHLRDVNVGAASKYFGGGGVPFDKLGQLDVDFMGDPEKPQQWQGSLRVRIDQLAAGTLKIPEVSASADFRSGTADVLANVNIGENRVKVDAKVGLPPEIDEFDSSEFDGNVDVNAPELGEILQSLTSKKGAGTLTANGRVGYHARMVSADLTVNAKDATLDTIALGALALKVKGTKRIDPAEKRPLVGLTADLQADGSGLRVGSFAIDAVRADASADNGVANVRELSVKRGVNTVFAKANGRLPDDPSKTELVQGTTTLAIEIPSLADFGIAVNGHTLGGELHTNGDIAAMNGKFTGGVKMTGGNFALGEFKTGTLTGSVKFGGDTLDIEDLTLAFNATDRLTVSGNGTPNAPFAYNGSLQLDFKDIAALQPLLTVFAVKEAVHGALHFSWMGRGGVQDKQHVGDAKVSLTKASYGTIKLDDVELGGSYTSDSAKVALNAAMGSTRFGTELIWSNQTVALQNLLLRQGDQKVLTGEIFYSLTPPPSPDQPFDPLRQPIRVLLRSDRLDLEKLLVSLGRPAPAAGQITMDLAVIGTPARPEIELNFTGRALKAKAAAQYDPAEVDLKLTYQPGALALNATARQPLIQPLTVRANAPLDIERVIQEKKLPSDLPLDASVKLPTTSLATIPKLTPFVRRADGAVAVDVQVGGTVEKPELSGAANLTIKAARLANENVPAIGQFDAHLVFAHDTLQFERFRGEIGGGNFDLLGSIKLARLDDPAFDLQLKAKEVLVKRDDSITVRSDADVKVGGTLKAGSITGEIAITQSRFFKEIDILPIGLPGKPKPAPKTAPSEPVIVLPPPLDKWKIDLHIITHQNDPFLVRGNLANGSVSVDLRVGNTGSQPWLDGMVTIDQFTGSLPFSTITVESGHVYFTKQNPLLPVLDIQAQSKIREYTVTAYIFGNAYQPQVQFSSEPPLSHADIVSLLATGSTTTDISKNADVLASRAALLALQSIWRKIFKPKSGAPAASQQAKQESTGSFLNRFDLELGGTDAATGAREATGKFKINDQLYLIGDLDVRGRYTGSLKYLIRFR